MSGIQFPHSNEKSTHKPRQREGTQTLWFGLDFSFAKRPQKGISLKTVDPNNMLHQRLGALGTYRLHHEKVSSQVVQKFFISSSKASAI